MRGSVSAASAALLLFGGSVFAQRGGGDWMTSAFDPQRSSWVRTDGKISPESMRKPGFELVWKMKFENAPRGLNGVTPPALLDFYIGYRGFRTLAFFGGSSNRIFAVDTDIHRPEWDKSLGAVGAAAAGTLDCPGGMTSAVTRPTSAGYPPIPLARGAGRSSPAKSGVSEPHAGAVTIRPVTTPPPAARRPAAARNATPDASNPFAARVQYVLALGADGKLHMMWVSNGNESEAALQFLPPNANAVGLVSTNGLVYAATENSCGGVDNGVWALDLMNKKVTHWKAAASVAGSAGPAIGPDGTVFAAAGDQLIALAQKTLETKGVYKTSGAQFTTSPVVFEFGKKDLVAAATDDGRIHVMDAAQIGTSLAQSPASGEAARGSLTSWQDHAGTRWILAAAGNKVVTWKLIDKGGKVDFEKGWTSRDMVSPLPPIVVNGVIFAVSSGEFRTSDANVSVAERVKRSTNAVLYALDGMDGKVLWSSGKTITSFVHSGGLSAGGTRVYVSGYDGTQYAFGFPIEH